jgi:hypothetical protein
VGVGLGISVLSVVCECVCVCVCVGGGGLAQVSGAACSCTVTSSCWGAAWLPCLISIMLVLRCGVAKYDAVHPLASLYMLLLLHCFPCDDVMSLKQGAASTASCSGLA